MTRDFFISYTKTDRAWAEWVAWMLESNNYTTVLQAWDFRPGENFVLQMHAAAERTRTTIILISDAYLSAEFTQPEWAAAFARDPSGHARRLIPIRVAPCTPAGLLGTIIYADIVDLSESDATDTVLDAVNDGRSKPSTSPPFPAPPASRTVPFPRGHVAPDSDAPEDSAARVIPVESGSTPSNAQPPIPNDPRPFWLVTSGVWQNTAGVIELVKHGWSWPAFSFGILWAISKRLALVACCNALAGLCLGLTMGSLDLDPGDGKLIFITWCSLAGLLYGAYGNAWRERNLARRGFRYLGSRSCPQLGLSHAVAALRAVWNHKFWRLATLAAAVTAVIGVVANTWLRLSPGERATDARLVEHCDRAVIRGWLKPNGGETFVWFEWGETPDLGNVTPKQRFREDAEFYQHLVGLKENTTYYYRAVLSGPEWSKNGYVWSFRTPPCSLQAPVP